MEVIDIDPILFLQIPKIFLKKCLQRNELKDSFSNTSEPVYTCMMSRILSDTFTESLSKTDLHKLKAFHKHLCITSKQITVWLCCMEETLYELGINAVTIDAFMKKLNVICDKLFCEPVESISIIDIISELSKESFDKKWVIDSLKKFS